MTFRNIFLSGLLVAGLAAAQSAPAAPPPGHHGGGHGGMLSELQLNDAQQTQLHQIMQDTHAAADPIQAQAKAIHEQLFTAVKSGATDAQIDQLSNQAGVLHAQMTALHTKAIAKVYALLTPDQKTKADAMGSRFLMMGPGPMGHGPHPPTDH